MLFNSRGSISQVHRRKENAFGGRMHQIQCQEDGLVKQYFVVVLLSLSTHLNDNRDFR